MAKKIILGTIILFLLFIGVLLFNTLTFTSRQTSVEAIDGINVPEDAVLRLAKATEYKTISDPEKPFDTLAFTGFHQYIKESFPLVDSLLNLEMVGGFSMLYTWEGQDPNLESIVLMSHQDVVPVDENSLDEWTAPPFAGEIVDGVLIGRGSMDDKVSLMAILEAIEILLSEGFSPNRTFYLAFGHDEEIGGKKGAKVIAELLETRGVKATMVLDEGGFMSENMVEGLSRPLSLINVAEKGYVSYELSIKTSGGHSSTPPRNNAIGSIAKAIYDLENHQLPYTMNSLFETQIDYIGPELPFLKKLGFANSWLFKDQVLAPFYGRTSTAPTIFNSGVKDNVLPTDAKAIINFRIVPGESPESVKEHIVSVIDNENITVTGVGTRTNPTPLNDNFVTQQYELIEKTVKQLNPDCITSPGLIMGGTDAKHFYGVSENIIRYVPIRVNPQNLPAVHGINERLPASNYTEIVQFYHQLILNSETML